MVRRYGGAVTIHWFFSAPATARYAAVYANLALRWDEEHPAVGVDPDVCLVDPTPPDPKLRCLRTCGARAHGAARGRLRW